MKLCQLRAFEIDPFRETELTSAKLQRKKEGSEVNISRSLVVVSLPPLLTHRYPEPQNSNPNASIHCREERRATSDAIFFLKKTGLRTEKRRWGGNWRVAAVELQEGEGGPTGSNHEINWEVE